MFSENQAFFPAAKAGFEAQLAMFTALTQSAIEHTGKIIDFNVNATKAHWEKSAASTKQLLSTQDPQERLSLVKNHAQENLQAAISYGRYMADLASTSRNEFTKEFEARSAESRRNISAAVDQMALKAPAGAEAGFALVKSAINNINAGYEQWTKAVQQAAAAMENQITAAADQVSQTAEKKPTSQAARK